MAVSGFSSFSSPLEEYGASSFFGARSFVGGGSFVWAISFFGATSFFASSSFFGATSSFGGSSFFGGSCCFDEAPKGAGKRMRIGYTNNEKSDRNKILHVSEFLGRFGRSCNLSFAPFIDKMGSFNQSGAG